MMPRHTKTHTNHTLAYYTKINVYYYFRKSRMIEPYAPSKRIYSHKTRLALSDGKYLTYIVVLKFV